MVERYKALAQHLSNKVIVNGQLQPAHATKGKAVVNPATLEEIASIPLCEAEDIGRASESASVAQKTWASIKAGERGKLVQACGQIIQEHAEELALLMSYETGKALRTESKVELSVIADTFSFYGGLALELKGETIPYDPNMLTMTIREPLGVVGAIIPWNVPLMLMAMKVAPALVAGNTVVLKPSSEATLCVLYAAELMNQILPAGVLNVVCGDGATGAALIAHPQINKVTFTGSVPTGRSVYKQAAEKLIPVTLELGGKSPLIICADADLEAVATSAIEGMRFTRQGQSCSAASRFLVHESIHDRFVEQLLKRLDNMVMGDPMDEKTDMGTVISKRQFDGIQQFLTNAEKDPQLQVHYACQLPSANHLQKGLFMRPALITGLNNSHEICQKEIFGPVAAILKWSDLNKAIADANNTEFGLAAGIWTRDLPTALRATHQLEAGFVQVNQYIVFRPSLPFGGFKHSGLGKEASLDAMLEHYTRQKTIIINMKG